MGRRNTYVSLLAGAMTFVLIGFEHGKAADPQPVEKRCYDTVDKGPCGTNDVGPALPPCINCWLWVSTTAGRKMGCERVEVGQADCIEGPQCVYTYREYSCSDDGEGNMQCVEDGDAFEHGEIPTKMGGGGVCKPPVVQPPEEPVEPE